MSNRSKVAKLWAQAPELAFSEVEKGIGKGLRVRVVAGVLESVLFEVEGVVPIDKETARQYAERCLVLAELLAFSPMKPRTSAFRVVAYAHAVLGRCRVAANQEELALIQFAKAEQLKALPQDIRGCVAMRRALALAQLRRFGEALDEADVAVYRYESCEVSQESEFNSLPSALLVRASIGVYGHSIGAYSAPYGLRDVLVDTRHALGVVEEGSPMEKGLIPSVVGTFGYLLAVEGYTGADLGLKLSELEDLIWRLEAPVAGSVFAAQLGWVEGLMEVHGRGRLVGERLLKDSRRIFMDHGMVDEAVKMTLDIQWFQLVSGRPEAAARECDFIADLIPQMRFDTDVMCQWVDAVCRRSVGEDVVERVFEEVRGLKGVGLRPSHLGR